MGMIFSRFRKQKTAFEKLEKIESEINEIEEFTQQAKVKQNNLLKQFIFVFCIYIICGFLWYYWRDSIYLSSPIIIILILIVGIKLFIGWFLKRRIRKSTNRLEKLRNEKKAILQHVQDTEKYKVAVEILNRFGDKPKPIVPIGNIRPTNYPNQQQQQQLIRRNPSKQLFLQSTPATRSMSATPSPSASSAMLMQTPSLSFNATPNLNMMPQRQQTTPFPIINYNQKSVFEKLIDKLVGDGANSRYAMICKACNGHNGMLPEEDYEYTPFRCAFCHTFNPAHKFRPKAPVLQDINQQASQQLQSDSSDSDDQNPDSEQVIETTTAIVNNNVEEIANSNNVGAEENTMDVELNETASTVDVNNLVENNENHENKDSNNIEDSEEISFSNNNNINNDSDNYTNNNNINNTSNNNNYNNINNSNNQIDNNNCSKTKNTNPFELDDDEDHFNENGTIAVESLEKSNIDKKNE